MVLEGGIFSCLFMFVPFHWDLRILSYNICGFVGVDIRSPHQSVGVQSFDCCYPNLTSCRLEEL